ncbi:MAG TPA: hypothetical protein VN516_09635 [Candidatus Baltobacteraceae bacterium]|nr:hypothetical protein [Candidatus Baltobacteraceae bacterium]
MEKKISDPITPWYSAVGELGDFIGMRFARVAPGSSEPEWIFVPHNQYDGVGAIVKMFGERGGKFDSLPQAKPPAKPPQNLFWRLLKLNFRSRGRLKWKSLGAVGKVPVPPQPVSAVAWHAFDENATAQMRAYCNKSGVTVNSFLLKHLTNTLRPYLETPAATVPWMIPVNLRGRVKSASETANHTSYLSVLVAANDSMQDIHRKIYEAVERDEPYLNWYAYTLGRFIPHAMKKFMIANELATSQWHIGAFSNLGVWDSEKKITAPDCQGTWLVSPPVLKFSLFGAGCIAFQSKLGLTLQAHPELTTDMAVCKKWMQTWIEHINAELVKNPLPKSREKISA